MSRNSTGNDGLTDESSNPGGKVGIADKGWSPMVWGMDDPSDPAPAVLEVPFPESECPICYIADELGLSEDDLLEMGKRDTGWFAIGDVEEKLGELSEAEISAWQLCVHLDFHYFGATA